MHFMHVTIERSRIFTKTKFLLDSKNCMESWVRLKGKLRSIEATKRERIERIERIRAIVVLFIVNYDIYTNAL